MYVSSGHLIIDVQHSNFCEQAIEECNIAPSEDEDDSPQLYDLANSIFEECKDTAPLSDLNTVIYLFREALDRRPAPHPLRLDSLKDLSAALVTRFSLTNQHEDLKEAFFLCSYSIFCKQF